MKIRTRLLLFFLPTLIGSIVLIGSLIAYNWHHFLGNLPTDVALPLLQEKMSRNFFLFFLSAALTIGLVFASLFIIANKISKPIQKLNNSALAIAAGQYGEPITADGPKEITELANTLNVMRECLLENINRLKENALLREKMYGEYECSILLQHLMLQKNIDDCRSDAIAVKAISFSSDNPRGLLLSLPKKNDPSSLEIELRETATEGFEGMYQLLAGSNHPVSHTLLRLDRISSLLHAEGSCLPFIWSLDKRRLVDVLDTGTPVEVGDFFFLYNQGFDKFWKGEAQIGHFLTKVLKVFAQDGMETLGTMLHKEIAFLTKRKAIKEDIHLICFQVLS